MENSEHLNGAIVVYSHDRGVIAIVISQIIGCIRPPSHPIEQTAALLSDLAIEPEPLAKKMNMNNVLI